MAVTFSAPAALAVGGLHSCMLPGCSVSTPSAKGGGLQSASNQECRPEACMCSLWAPASQAACEAQQLALGTLQEMEYCLPLQERLAQLSQGRMKG